MEDKVAAPILSFLSSPELFSWFTPLLPNYSGKNNQKKMLFVSIVI